MMLAPTPYFSDRGCHVRIYEEAKALHALGVDVRIITYHLGRDLPPIPTYRTWSVPWYNKREAGPSWHKPYLDIFLLYRALQVAKKFKPDIVHAHLHEGAFIGILLKKWLKIPLLFDYQGSLTAEIAAHGFVAKGSHLYRLFACLEQAINRGADLIVTSSTSSAATLETDWKVPSSSVATVIDGVDADFFKPLEKEEPKKKLHLPLGVTIIGFLGLLNEYQGVDILLQAACLLKQRNTKCHFLIMGFPEKEYVEKSRRLGLENLMTFTGKIDYENAPRYLSVCDIAVSPKISLSEANGKLFNYMACGLPTVVFDTPINREILGDTGIYARFGDPTDLADKLTALAEDNENMQEVARRVRTKAVEEHSWSNRGVKLRTLYQRLQA